MIIQIVLQHCNISRGMNTRSDVTGSFFIKSTVNNTPIWYWKCLNLNEAGPILSAKKIKQLSRDFECYSLTK